MKPLFHKHISLQSPREPLVAAPPKKPLKHARILFAEDSLSQKKTFLKTLSGLLSDDKEGLSIWEKNCVTWTPNGREAISLFRNAITENKFFDLVILDNQLEDSTTGQRVAIKLRRLGYTGPLLMLTSADPRDLCTPQATPDGSFALALTTAMPSVDSDSYELHPLIQDALISSDITPIPAYFSAKPCDKKKLRHILAEHFDLSVKPRTDSIDEHPIRSQLNNFFKEATNPESGVLIEKDALENLVKFKTFLLQNRSPVAMLPNAPNVQLLDQCGVTELPKQVEKGAADGVCSNSAVFSKRTFIDYAQIPQKDPERHMIACAFNTLMTTIPETQDATYAENTWISDCIATIEQLFQDIETHKMLIFSKDTEIQGKGF
jgi:CheY-like chemotaxis protein